MEQNTTQISVTERRLLPDLIRAWAIIGIVLVNVEVFSQDFMTGYGETGIRSSADYAAAFVVLSLFTVKSYSLFSLMFGAGLAFQMQAAQRAGKAFTPRFMRRLLGLLILGFLHAIFLFIGDILVTYAVLGLILFFCRNGRPRDLWLWGCLLIGFQAVLLLGLGGLLWVLKVTDPEMYASQMAMEMEAINEVTVRFTEVYSSGGFLAVAEARIPLLPIVYQAVPVIQGISAMGFFLIGLALVKTGSISDVSAKIWRWGRVVGLPVGLIGSVFGAYLFMAAPSHNDPEAMIAMGVLIAASPFSTFGYAGWIAKVAEGGHRPIVDFLARGGSATLTAYLLQSIILSTVFAGYGLGLFQQLGAGWNILIALVTGLFTLAFASMWLTRFKRGPFEMVLRRFTYWGSS